VVEDGHRPVLDRSGAFGNQPGEGGPEGSSKRQQRDGAGELPAPDVLRHQRWQRLGREERAPLRVGAATSSRW
jgi:hypothetical protein